MNKKILLGIGVGVVSLLLIFILMKVTVKNKERRLRNQVVAQQLVYETNYDKMFKVIAQVAQLPDHAKNTFKEIYTDLIKGRYSNERGGALMSWIVENNPQFPFNLYDRLAEVIEANRADFFNEGRKLADFQREHKNLVMNWPGNWFYSAKDTVSITLITSERTKEVFATGEDNNIELFPKRDSSHH